MPPKLPRDATLEKAYIYAEEWGKRMLAEMDGHRVGPQDLSPQDFPLSQRFAFTYSLRMQDMLWEPERLAKKLQDSDVGALLLVRVLEIGVDLGRQRAMVMGLPDHFRDFVIELMGTNVALAAPSLSESRRQQWITKHCWGPLGDIGNAERVRALVPEFSDKLRDRIFNCTFNSSKKFQPLQKKLDAPGGKDGRSGGQGGKGRGKGDTVPEAGKGCYGFGGGDAVSEGKGRYGFGSTPTFVGRCRAGETLGRGSWQASRGKLAGGQGGKGVLAGGKGVLAGGKGVLAGGATKSARKRAKKRAKRAAKK